MQGLLPGKINTDFKNMALSVVKYGGFYVGRYEAGYDEENKVTVSMKNKKVLTAATDNSNVCIGLNDWYGLYTVANKEIATGTSTIQSHMIYGSQYDQIINFLENNKSNEPQIGHSTRQLKTQELTGSNGLDLMNNIFDLEGNNLEVTVEAYSDNYRVDRGGDYGYAKDGFFTPASRRYYANPTSIPAFPAAYRVTSRVSLFIK